MDIPKQYDPSLNEDKWYKAWQDKAVFKSVPDERESYTIVIPPPNVTGVLHMGHMLNNTIQDVLIRRARLQGKNACWVPGTDHASIATEAKVVQKLKNDGIEKESLSREEFLTHAWEWKEKHGGIILEQLKKLGASCDWDRTRFTMDPDMSDAVLDTFIDLYNKGLIYRGVRMINWDPSAQTALSDEEVIYKESQSALHYVMYRMADGNGSITIATTRPETILGDTAICVHPDDERYTSFIGRKVIVPMMNREIPVIADTYVEREFGTGALKVTPAHDLNDYHLGVKHQLPVIDVILSDGTMSPEAGSFQGMDRFKARKAVVEELKNLGQWLKEEPIMNNVGHSERTDSVIEPRLSLQWFLKMEEMAKPALEAVTSGRVKLHPAKFVNTYKHWMENCKDWCISRQLWWGQRIPAWYSPKGTNVAAKTAEEALLLFANKGEVLTKNDIHQDEDVLDTWFSSWLWPITVFDPQAIRKSKEDWNDDLKYYYPTQDLVTAPEILFFWVARMIMAGLEYGHDIPFSNVYLTGIVRDKLGRKMSKSLGNSPNPLDLIAKYGADGVRVGMLLTSPAGNDLPFDEALCEQGRNFNNKLWNAFRLVHGWNAEEKDVPLYAAEATEWFKIRLAEQTEITNDLFGKYRISEALMGLYTFVWDDFCSWYLEALKPPNGEQIDANTKNKTISFFEDILRLLSPFIPFITEEIWHWISHREEGRFLCIDRMPENVSVKDSRVLTEGKKAQELVSALRNFRVEKNISPKQKLQIACKPNSAAEKLPFIAFTSKLANIDAVEYVSERPEKSFSLHVANAEIYIQLQEGDVNVEEEKSKLHKELVYTRGFLESVMKKLGNERFIASAKTEIIANEEAKRSDAEKRIKMIEEQLQALED